MKKKYAIIILVPIIILLFIFVFSQLDKKQLSSEQYLDLYEQIISQIVDTGDYKDAKYIAVDANSFGIGNDQEKGLLMKYLRKYNSDIVIGSYDLIKKNKGLVDNEGNLEGVLFYCTNLDRKGKNVTIDVTALTTDSKVMTFKANYLLNKWTITTNSTLIK